MCRALKSIKSFRYGVENRHGIFNFVQGFLSIQPVVTEDFVLFCESFLNAIESEKDPRNLMTIFDTIHYMSKMPLNSDYIEEFFESIFCYFPITFRSNPSDPNLITVEELKGSLRRAIAGDSRFGDLAVPVLIEKLSLNSSSAKIDSLDVFLEASNIYDPISFSQFTYQLEVAIFSEITGNTDTKIQSKSLQLVRLLASVLPEESAINWRSKFLREAVKAVELDSREIMSKSAVMIEAVASSSESSFKFALDTCADILVKTALQESFSIKSQAARNCLVALFSPLKNNEAWINLVANSGIVSGLETLFVSVDCGIDSYGVYLVIFSFVGPVLSRPSVDAFVNRFFDVCKLEFHLTNELKNCIWLASKSCPEAFFEQLNLLENDEIVSASASTARLARISLKRLVELDRIAAIEEVLMKADLSEVANEVELVRQLLELPLNSISIVKLFSKLDLKSQVGFIELRPEKLETFLIGARPEVIEACVNVISHNLCSIRNSNAVASLFNKCPKLFSSDLFVNNCELYLASIRGLIYRMDNRALELLKSNPDDLQVNYCAKMFKEQASLFTSEETFHVKKGLHLQWILNFVLKNCESINSLALLVSILSIAPPSLIQMNYSVLSDLVLKFLLLCDDDALSIALDARMEAWQVLVPLLDHSKEINVDLLIQLASRHIFLKNEPSSLIRFSASKILSKLIANSSTRTKCYDYQSSVLLVLKSGPLGDSKRAVRQEAARANNLWHVLREEGVLP